MAVRIVLVSALAALLTTGCTTVVGGTALLAGGPAGPGRPDVGRVLLSQEQMQAITGGGEDLTIIPSMDSPAPVDVETLAGALPRPCNFLMAETVTFGPDLVAFHKTSYQYPPRSALISQGAAAYRDAERAGAAFTALRTAVQQCAADDSGAPLIGEWTADGQSLRIRPGDCGRDYRLASALLVEVTFCGFPESVPAIVMTNILRGVPGR